MTTCILQRDGQGLTGQLESELASLRAQLAAAQVNIECHV